MESASRLRPRAEGQRRHGEALAEFEVVLQRSPQLAFDLHVDFRGHVGCPQAAGVIHRRAGACRHPLHGFASLVLVRAVAEGESGQRRFGLGPQSRGGSLHRRQVGRRARLDLDEGRKGGGHRHLESVFLARLCFPHRGYPAGTGP